MLTVSPILACSSMRISAGDAALLDSLIIGWLISLILVLVNLCLIAIMDASPRFKVTNVGVFSIYTISAFALFIGGFGDTSSWAIFVPIFGVPVLVISHFAYLLWIRKKLRRQPTTPDDT